MTEPALPWATWPWRRCRAVREPGQPDGWHGRCELRRSHDGLHALDRGMELVRWSTRWAAPEADGDPALLTDTEHELVELLGKVAGGVSRMVLGGDPAVATGDRNELVAAVHVLQYRVLAQAAARAYPDRYRLLGRRGEWERR